MNEQIGNKINDKAYIPLPPFKGWVLENFPFIENDFDCLTNYQMLCLMFKKLNDVIANQNTVQQLGSELVVIYNAFVDAVNSAINEFETDVTADINQFKIDTNTEISNFETFITGKFNELKDFVDNYFDNLDVQEEINTKLDEMVQDGTLPEIIADYLNSKAIFGYDNVASMKLATNLINGSYAETLGFYNKNDGGSALYKIRTKTNDDVINEYDLISLYDNTLVAEFIESEIVNIKQVGYNDTMTESVQTSFLNYVCGKYTNILIKDEDLTINDTILLISNQNIKLENSSILNTTTTNSKYIFRIVGQENVNIIGIDSTLSFNKPETAQQACIGIHNSKNVYCEGLTLTKAGGDGLIVGGNDDTIYSENINVYNLTIDNNRRNGISVVGGIKKLTIKNCRIINTSGVNPQYGIDLEPWQHEENRDGSNKNVIIENCIFEGNAGGGIDIIYYNKGLTIRNNIFNSNNLQSALIQAKGANAYPKNVLITNNEFNNAGIYLRGTQFAEYVISDNKFDGKGIATDSEIDLTPFYNVNPQNGYLVIKNNVIRNANNHGIVLNSVSNALVEGNLIEKPYNRCITTISSNNVNIVNNTFMDHAQNSTDTAGITCLNFQTTHNIKIDGNLFIDKNPSITFSRLMLFDGSCQKLIAVNNNALNSTYTNFISKYAVITNEVIDNNLTNV